MKMSLQKNLSRSLADGAEEGVQKANGGRSGDGKDVAGVKRSKGSTNQEERK